MLTRLRLRLLQLRLWLMSLKDTRRERYRRRYYEIMKTPSSQLTDKDLADFRKIYEYFNGDIDKI